MAGDGGGSGVSCEKPSWKVYEQQSLRKESRTMKEETMMPTFLHPINGQWRQTKPANNSSSNRATVASFTSLLCIKDGMFMFSVRACTREQRSN